MTKSSWEGQGSFPLILPFLRLSSKETRAWTKGRNSEAENEAETRKERCLPACSPWLAQVTFLDTPGLPAQGHHHPPWARPSPSIVNQDNITTDLLTGQSSQNIFSPMTPHSQTCLGLCQIDTKVRTCTWSHLRSRLIMMWFVKTTQDYQGRHNCSSKSRQKLWWRNLPQGSAPFPFFPYTCGLGLSVTWLLPEEKAEKRVCEEDQGQNGHDQDMKQAKSREQEDEALQLRGPPARVCTALQQAPF